MEDPDAKRQELPGAGVSGQRVSPVPGAVDFGLAPGASAASVARSSPGARACLIAGDPAGTDLGAKGPLPAEE
eukprot:16437489-Heterocapsa_arctica.AAC.1